jgi:Icc-related predicted phosphoesterase
MKTGMKAIFITDIHGETERLGKLPAADLLIIGGDITTFGTAVEISAFVLTAQKKYPQVVAVLGNCDPLDGEAALQKLGVAIDKKVLAIGSLTLIGNSGSNPTPSDTPYEWDDATRFRELTSLLPDCDGRHSFIFVTHAPPYQSGADRLPNGTCVGSKAARNFMDALNNPLVLCGHIHNAEGIFNNEKTGGQTVNPGPFSQGKYAKITFTLVPDLYPMVELATVDAK